MGSGFSRAAVFRCVRRGQPAAGRRPALEIEARPRGPRFRRHALRRGRAAAESYRSGLPCRAERIQRNERAATDAPSLATGIIRAFPKALMEAEHINAIAKRLDDVENRAAELRRYL